MLQVVLNLHLPIPHQQVATGIRQFVDMPGAPVSHPASSLRMAEAPTRRLRARRAFSYVMLVGVGLLMFAGYAAADPAIVATVHSFGDGSVAGDGIIPLASPCLAKDGNYYGVTLEGGAANLGTIFKMTPTGFVKILHSFGDGSVKNDGFDPRASLMQAANGSFYGTTNEGGSAGHGTIFKATSSGVITILHSFGAVSGDGYEPENGLTQLPSGTFYGVTTFGGSADLGTVYKMNSAGTVTVLHSFGDGSIANDGSGPDTDLVPGTDGNLYGATLEGGSKGEGTIFKISPTGVLAIIYSFDHVDKPSDGENPAAFLIGNDGNYYGSCLNAGADGAGMLFEVTPGGAENSTVAMQAAPEALIQDAAGNLYGVTLLGGTADQGSLFRVVTGGGGLVSTVTLHNFGDGTIPNDGIEPQGISAAPDGSLYGLAASGGAEGLGTIYHARLPLSVERSFSAADNDPIAVYSSIIQGSDGDFYGTSNVGGSKNSGTVFKVTPGGVLTVLHSFGSVSGDGIFPVGNVAQGSDGNYYGTTELGGAHNKGIVFKITPAGAYSKLHSFGAGTSDGAEPQASLMLAASGKLYGTTAGGGKFGEGTVYKMTNAGAVTVLYSFGSSGTDGLEPLSGVIQGPDGNFYGTTYRGGKTDQGTVYQMTTAGKVTILYPFGEFANDGLYPQAGLCEGTDGYLYGVTSSDSSTGNGRLFRISTTGAYSDYSSLPDLVALRTTTTALVRGPGATFYGSSSGNGISSFGSIFQFDPVGSLTVAHQFSDGSVENDGASGYSGLTFGSDGNYYGVSLGGGAAGQGAFFRYEPGLPVSNLAVNPASIKGGTTTSGAVTLQEVAPPGGILVVMSSGNAAVSVPSLVTVSGGEVAARFPITTKSVTGQTAVTITATCGGASQTATVTLKP